MAIQALVAGRHAYAREVWRSRKCIVQGYVILVDVYDVVHPVASDA